MSVCLSVSCQICQHACQLCSTKKTSRRGSTMHAKSDCDPMAQESDISKATHSWYNETCQAKHLEAHALLSSANLALKHMCPETDFSAIHAPKYQRQTAKHSIHCSIWSPELPAKSLLTSNSTYLPASLHRLEHGVACITLSLNLVVAGTGKHGDLQQSMQSSLNVQCSLQPRGFTECAMQALAAATSLNV